MSRLGKTIFSIWIFVKILKVIADSPWNFANWYGWICVAQAQRGSNDGSRRVGPGAVTRLARSHFEILTVRLDDGHVK